MSGKELLKILVDHQDKEVLIWNNDTKDAYKIKKIEVQKFIVFIDMNLREEE